MMQFELSDIPRILPEILLLVLALIVLGADVFGRWGSSQGEQQRRNLASGALTALGLATVFAITLLQSGYVYTVSVEATGPLDELIRRLQAGGPTGAPIGAEPLLGAFATDHIAMVARLLFVGAALLTVLLTFDFQPAGHPGEFYTLIIVSTLGMCLMAAASEFVLAFIAIELTSIPLYVLAGYFLADRQSAEAGMKYFLFGALSSAILLYGMSLVYGFATTTAATIGADGGVMTQFSQIAAVIGAAGDQATPGLLTVGVLFIVAGLGYKVAVVPFHSWSPDVYQGAPTPITAFISTASKAAGFLLLFRLLTSTFPALVGSPVLAGLGAGAEAFGGWTSAIALVGLATLVWGNLAALPQTNARRLLAYSSIAHAGFVVLALLAWASPLAADRSLGVSALLYYLVAYSVTNLGAFGALAVVSMAVGGDEISDLNGLAQRNIGLAVLLTIFIFSLAGIPPLSGFIAKFYVFMAGWQSGAQWLVVVGVLSTLIGLYYYLRIVRAIFMAPPDSDKPLHLPPTMGLTLTVAAVIAILIGIFPNLVLAVIDQAQGIAAGA